MAATDPTPTRAGPAVRVCFVCLGNICRSPTAEAVFVHLVREAGLSPHFEIDSAGTAAYHVGDSPDRRATAEARRRGVEMVSRGRQFRRGDFELFDLVLAMDESNHADLVDLTSSPDQRAKVRRLREWDPESRGPHDLDVPDPYYGGDRGFAEVYDMVERSGRALLADLVERHGLTSRPAEPDPPSTDG